MDFWNWSQVDGDSALRQAKAVIPAACLALFWAWETWQPLLEQRPRLRHGARNLTLGLINTAALAVLFGAATAGVAGWTQQQSFGLLPALELRGGASWIASLVLLDAWMYLWHRANHRIPLLWRFHRTHHSDRQMDVTSALRFHLGEQVLSSTLRLGVIALLGLQIGQVILYELLVIVGTQFHHSNITLGRWDAPLRWLIVTPDMHKIHHSRVQVETDSNYSTVLSLWDRLARTFRMRSDPATVEFGLDEFDDERWQTLAGLFQTPLRSDPRESK